MQSRRPCKPSLQIASKSLPRLLRACQILHHHQSLSAVRAAEGSRLAMRFNSIHQALPHTNSKQNCHGLVKLQTSSSSPAQPRHQPQQPRLSVQPQYPRQKTNTAPAERRSQTPKNSSTTSGTQKLMRGPTGHLPERRRRVRV